jgi:tyrosinase
MSLSLHLINSLLRILLVLLTLSGVRASPTPYPGFGLSVVATQQSSPFAITGLAGQSVQARLEIRDLQQNAEQWSLFLLGLQRLQSMNQTDFLSWFQIAGK